MLIPFVCPKVNGDKPICVFDGRGTGLGKQECTDAAAAMDAGGFVIHYATLKDFGADFEFSKDKVVLYTGGNGRGDCSVGTM